MEEFRLFTDPRSVALIGATDREGAAGCISLENLLAARDRRRIYPVNPHREKVFDLTCFPGISALPEVPDLVVVVTPAETVPGIVEECGKTGVRAMIIISSGFKEIGGEGIVRHEQLAALAEKYRIRIMGPNCMGVIRPSANLNTTIFRKMPKPGYIAFVTQSGALGAGILDWAVRKNIGFSALVSLGSMLGVDFADTIDYFGQDAQTRSIIIYPESIGNARKFMSAARGFARTKPIIILKPGRCEESAAVARTHTGAMLSEDMYYSAIFRRAGVVRVEEMKDLFWCASIMNSMRLPKGNRLAIITNGGGPAALATDNLVSRGGSLAALGKDTIAALTGFLPPTWSHSNPVDIREDATTQRFLDALKVTAADPGVDGLLIIYTPQGAADPRELAQSVVALARELEKPVLTALIGGDDVAEARQFLYQNQIPAFEYPEDAIRTYLYMYEYGRNLEMLYETPEESPVIGAPRNHLRAIIRRAFESGRSVLSAEDSVRLLSSYGIPVPRQFLVNSAEAAASAAADIGFPVAMKISSPGILHKSDEGGLALNIKSEEEARATFDHLTRSVRERHPDLDIDGVIVQKMVLDADYELIVGCKKDPLCGPVIMFGQGGIEAEFLKDVAVGLPPLNKALARRVIEQTRIYRLLSKGFRTKPPLDLRLLDDILVKVSNLVVDFPEIKELDLNPVMVNRQTTAAVDPRIVLDEAVLQNGCHEEYSHLIITPYPTRYIQPWRCKDGRFVLLRPIKPDDEALAKNLLESLPDTAMRYRFFYVLKEFNHEMLTRFCNIDYEREIAIIAEYAAEGKRRCVGMGTIIVPAGSNSAEFALVVAQDFEGNGLGLKISDILIGIAQEKGLKSLHGIVLNENTRMLGLAKRLGFCLERLSTTETKINLEL